MKSSSFAMPTNKNHLNTANEAATVVVKDEDRFNAIKAMELCLLLPEEVVAQDAMLKTMKKVCHVYNKDFRNLHETQELKNR